jgi:DNA-binding NtrC family response regulator
MASHGVHRVVVIDGLSGVAPSGIYEELAADPAFACQRIAWDHVEVAELKTEVADLVLAVATTADIVPEVCERLTTRSRSIPVFAIVPTDVDGSVLTLISRTADDFMLAPPVRPAELRHRLSRVLAAKHELELVRRTLLEEIGSTQLVGRAPAFLAAIRQIPRLARAEAPVLITGETGTGKELCARALHHLGRRRQYPFVAVDCGALPDQLIENELFGHARGAFTDAHRDQKGMIAIAQGGTLFLDEVDALSTVAQAKLLRFLQDQTFRPLGADRLEQADVKIIAASNRDLDATVAAKTFRMDLYFRLNVLRIQLPPLRERQGDIELLAHDLLADCRASCDGSAQSFSPAALRVLAAYSWPGNVRELRNTIHRAVVECDGDRLHPFHLHLPEAEWPDDGPLRRTLRAGRATVIAAFERRYVEELLRKHRGNVTHAAREAQQDRRAFGRFIKKYKIDRRTLIA